MKTIYKYPLNNYVSIPEDAEILTVGIQGGSFVLWALVDTTKPFITRRFEIFGTGWGLPDDILKKTKYIDTVFEDTLVWHIFEVLE